jgi:hypothetical protein
MSSILFSDPEETDEMRTLFEQLILVRDRHSTLKTFVNSIRAQLQQSFNLALAELQGKRNLLISQVDLLYDEHFSKLCNFHKEKEKRIQDKDDELSATLDEIENLIQRLESSEDFERIQQEVNQTLQVWVSENEVTGEWAEVPAPEFKFFIVPAEEAKKNRQVRADEGKNLGKNSKCMKKHRSHKHENCRSTSKNRSFENMLKQNNQIEHRVNQLENLVTNKWKPPKPEKKIEDRFDLDKSESPISISTLYTDDSHVANCDGRVKIYVPHGYPAYSCFYLVKVAKDVTVSQVSEKIGLHVGITRSRLKVKDGEKMKKIDPNEKAYHLIRYKVYLEKINV